MPATFEVDRTSSLIEVRFTGSVVIRDLLPRVPLGTSAPSRYSLLVDLLDADVRGIDSGALRESARRSPVHGPVAIVARAGLGYGLARMYEMAGENERAGPVGVFHSRPDAMAWLAALQQEQDAFPPE